MQEDFGGREVLLGRDEDSAIRYAFIRGRRFELGLDTSVMDHRGACVRSLVRACVRAAHVRATIETASPCHSPFFVFLRSTGSTSREIPFPFPERRH